MYLKLNNFSDLPLYFTTRFDGVSPLPFISLNLAFHTGDSPQNVIANRQLLLKKLNIEPALVKTVRQVHSSEIKIVDKDYLHTWESPYEELETADGLITAEKGVFLSVFLADCFAVYIFDPVQEVIALLHAGWRGVRQNIIENAINIMQKSFSSNPSDCLVQVSPGLQKCCFEVKAESFPILEWEWKARDTFEERDGKLYFDLTSVISQRLINNGVFETNLARSSLCTACDLRFFSYRREGTTGRMAALVRG